LKLKKPLLVLAGTLAIGLMACAPPPPPHKPPVKPPVTTVKPPVTTVQPPKTDPLITVGTICMTMPMTTQRDPFLAVQDNHHQNDRFVMAGVVGARTLTSILSYVNWPKTSTYINPVHWSVYDTANHLLAAGTATLPNCNPPPTNRVTAKCITAPDGAGGTHVVPILEVMSKAGNEIEVWAAGVGQSSTVLHGFDNIPWPRMLDGSFYSDITWEIDSPTLQVVLHGDAHLPTC